ncbi:MAG: dihydroorotate oxidase, partial [Spirochaetales bacterium]|nr:dihydroorotate oxidase [Spirochaetales bacterium]
FNRYYSPDIDTEKLSVRSADIFSQPGEYTLPLRWVSLLSGKTALPLIGSSGIHDGQGVIKMLLAGSPAVEVVSALYRHGVKRITEMNAELTTWMDAHGYSTLDDFRGMLAANAGDNRGALERFHYMKTYGGASE